MDKFEKRLKRDADAIEAEVSPELRARIDASLHGIEPLRPASARPPSSPASLWWASSLTGLAAAVLIIVLVNWNRTGPAPALEGGVAELTVPADPEQLPMAPLLDIRTADFASPLEEELIKLQSDIEKARESVKKDLDFTF
jgi:hypothetical protein